MSQRLPGSEPNYMYFTVPHSVSTHIPHEKEKQDDKSPEGKMITQFNTADKFTNVF